MELWDAYDKDGNLLDFKLVRGEEIAAGVYHIVCEALVRHTDGDFLLMKRAMSKEAYPGFYEATCGGSALVGETPDICIKRELFEETGIRAENFEHYMFNLYDDGAALYHSYIVNTDWPKEKITLQEGETEGFKWVNKEEFMRFIASDEAIDTQVKRWIPYLEREGLIKT